MWFSQSLMCYVLQSWCQWFGGFMQIFMNFFECKKFVAEAKFNVYAHSVTHALLL